MEWRARKGPFIKEVRIVRRGIGLKTDIVRRLRGFRRVFQDQMRTRGGRESNNPKENCERPS